jgi:hypothetical protein
MAVEKHLMTDHWDFFNWPEILREAKLRHDLDPKVPLEYWTAWCAHANAAACADDIAVLVENA